MLVGYDTVAKVFVQQMPLMSVIDGHVDLSNPVPVHRRGLNQLGDALPIKRIRATHPAHQGIASLSIQIKPSLVCKDYLPLVFRGFRAALVPESQPKHPVDDGGIDGEYGDKLPPRAPS